MARIGGGRVNKQPCSLEDAQPNWEALETLIVLVEAGGFADTYKFMETDGGTEGFYDEKVNNLEPPGTYNTDDHQAVRYQIEVDGTITPFTNKGAGGGTDEELVVKAGGTPGRLEEIVHADSWVDPDEYAPGEHFPVILSPTSNSVFRAYFESAIIKNTVGDSAPGHLIDKWENVVSSTYSPLEDIPVKFEDLGSTIIAFIDFSDYPIYSVDDSGFVVSSLRSFKLTANKLLTDATATAKFMNFDGTTSASDTTLYDLRSGPFPNAPTYRYHFAGRIDDNLYADQPAFHGQAAYRINPADPTSGRWEIVNMEGLAEFVIARFYRVSNYPGAGSTLICRYQLAVNNTAWDIHPPAAADEEINFPEDDEDSILALIPEPEHSADAESEPLEVLMQLTNPDTSPPTYRVYYIIQPANQYQEIRYNFSTPLAPGDAESLTDTSGVEAVTADGSYATWVLGPVRIFNHSDETYAVGNCLCDYRGIGDGYYNFSVKSWDVVKSMKYWLNNLSGDTPGAFIRTGTNTYSFSHSECEE